MTLKEWKAGLKVGQKLLCTYRWYWNMPTANPVNFKPAPPNGELCELVEVRATQCIMKTATVARSWMQYPRASELKATESGFELYFPIENNRPYPENPDWSGKLMSRYEYLNEDWTPDGYACSFCPNRFPELPALMTHNQAVHNGARAE